MHLIAIKVITQIAFGDIIPAPRHPAFVFFVFGRGMSLSYENVATEVTLTINQGR